MICLSSIPSNQNISRSICRNVHLITDGRDTQMSVSLPFPLLMELFEFRYCTRTFVWVFLPRACNPYETTDTLGGVLCARFLSTFVICKSTTWNYRRYYDRVFVARAVEQRLSLKVLMSVYFFSHFPLGNTKSFHKASTSNSICYHAVNFILNFLYSWREICL